MPSPPPAEPLAIPGTAPVIVLPECNLLPHALLPLFIFEPRYREMLSDALSSDRVFCLGMRKPGVDDEAPLEKAVYDCCTIGLIRASVTHEDGTSHLVLQGVRRVRILSWLEGKAYPFARVEPMSSILPSRLQAEALARKILETAHKLVENGLEISAQLRDSLESIEDPETIGDVVAYNFIRDPYTRQALIETADVSARLRHVIGLLSAAQS